MNNITCTICNGQRLTPINSFCQFTKQPIYRYKCEECSLIFGPINYIKMSQSELIEQYKILYSKYNESDTTEYEVKTFLKLNPSQNKNYLNYGSGIWSKSKKIINDMGYNIDCYDISFDDLNSLNGTKKYDGIMSHNLIEHLQNPIETFNLFKTLLKPNGVMVHSTSCYKYQYEYSIFHLHFLLDESISVLANKTGFTVEECHNEPDYIIKKFKLI